MPGARLSNFRMGDRTELLVEYFMNMLAFTTPVPRQEDVGHDLLCSLAEPHGQMLWAGTSFAVQVKSDVAAIVFAKDYEWQWLTGQENPFFIAVGHKIGMRVDLYSTWPRVRAFLQHGPRKTTLKFEAPPRVGLEVEGAADGSEHTIYLGKPIVSVTMEQLQDVDALDNVRNVLRAWVELDRRNIVTTKAGIHWTVGPVSYETNVVPQLDVVQMALFWNSQNLGTCMQNFARSAAFLRLTLQIAPMRDSPDRISALDAALKAWAEEIDPGSKDSLAKYCGLAL